MTTISQITSYIKSFVEPTGNEQKTDQVGETRKQEATAKDNTVLKPIKVPVFVSTRPIFAFGGNSWGLYFILALFGCNNKTPEEEFPISDLTIQGIDTIPSSLQDDQRLEFIASTGETIVTNDLDNVGLDHGPVYVTFLGRDGSEIFRTETNDHANISGGVYGYANGNYATAMRCCEWGGNSQETLMVVDSMGQDQQFILPDELKSFRHIDLDVASQKLYLANNDQIAVVTWGNTGQAEIEYYDSPLSYDDAFYSPVALQDHFILDYGYTISVFNKQTGEVVLYELPEMLKGYNYDSDLRYDLKHMPCGENQVIFYLHSTDNPEAIIGLVFDTESGTFEELSDELLSDLIDLGQIVDLSITNRQLFIPETRELIFALVGAESFTVVQFGN